VAGIIVSPFRWLFRLLGSWFLVFGGVCRLLFFSLCGFVERYIRVRENIEDEMNVLVYFNAFGVLVLGR
jgi:hypothetical protein